MSNFGFIKMPYGFCKELRRTCPCPDDDACTIDKNYMLCSKFEKKGEARAIEEIDGDGKRRISFTFAKGAKCVGGQGGVGRDNPSTQQLLGDRIGWQKIKGAVVS
jgi:hypothetical protein